MDPTKYITLDIWPIIGGKLIQAYDFNTLHALKHTCRDIYRTFLTLCKPGDSMYVVEEAERCTDMEWGGMETLIVEYDICCKYGDTTLLLSTCEYNLEKKSNLLICKIFVEPHVYYKIRVDCANNRNPSRNVIVYHGMNQLLCSGDLSSIKLLRTMAPRHARIIEYMWELIIQHKYVREFVPFDI